jgi:hypothetical protein
MVSPVMNGIFKSCGREKSKQLEVNMVEKRQYIDEAHSLVIRHWIGGKNA